MGSGLVDWMRHAIIRGMGYARLSKESARSNSTRMSLSLSFI